MRVKNPDSLRRWRKQRRFSQEQLASLARCSQNTISLLELGRMKTCTASLAVDIATWLEVPWAELFEAEEFEVVPGVASSLDTLGSHPIRRGGSGFHHRRMSA
ncbi:helix-turn-helix domain-containing protein [Paenarthrobacter sp. AT5]|uniref:helix-turn-helix transcriptional regulator n=1 Tax=Paenarthrobacter TaxID=1742992 RepID=UPI001A97EF02|nr:MULTISPECIES: helix-turn-helix domain-containing protein [Paenarthrobacter]QSZ53306.1 hypothetical protein AYX19_09995 [Paenarthrobacter ureafaciens]WOC59868.1 helix-turn-helix domain-containing protein [Paenarthrobacter sp. AT5]